MYNRSTYYLYSIILYEILKIIISKTHFHHLGQKYNVCKFYSRNIIHIRTIPIRQNWIQLTRYIGLHYGSWTQTISLVYYVNYLCRGKTVIPFVNFFFLFYSELTLSDLYYLNRLQFDHHISLERNGVLNNAHNMTYMLYMWKTLTW